MNPTEKTWHGLRVASLSLVPGVGHLYLGEKRGYWIIAITIAVIIYWKFFWAPTFILYMSWAIFAAVDAYGIARRGRGLF